MKLVWLKIEKVNGKEKFIPYESAPCADYIKNPQGMVEFCPPMDKLSFQNDNYHPNN